MDYCYDNEKEDGRDKRRFSSLPQYTPEQLEKASANELRSLIWKIETEREKEQAPEYIRILDSWHRTLSRKLKRVEELNQSKPNE